jgi:hypothetical protein
MTYGYFVSTGTRGPEILKRTGYRYSLALYPQWG